MNPVTTSSRIEKIVKKVKILVSGSSAVVKLMTHIPMFKSSNPVIGTGREKMVPVAQW